MDSELTDDLRSEGLETRAVTSAAPALSTPQLDTTAPPTTESRPDDEREVTTEEDEGRVALWLSDGAAAATNSILILFTPPTGFDRDYTLHFELDPALAQHFTALRPYGLSGVDVAGSVEGTELQVQIARQKEGYSWDGGDEYHIALVDFHGPGNGEYEITPTHVTSEFAADRATYTLVSDTLVVADPWIDITSGTRRFDRLPVGHCEQSYCFVLKGRHFDSEPRFALTAGAMPPGVRFLANYNGLASGTIAPASAGTYRFTVAARSGGVAISREFEVLVTNSGPMLERAALRMQTPGPVVLPGDEIELRFSEPVHNTAGWANSLQPTIAGDSFGDATLRDGKYDTYKTIVLGEGVRLTRLGDGAAIRVVPADGGLVDSEGVRASGEVEISDAARGWFSAYWTLNKTIDPVTLSHPCFADPGIEVKHLPQGLSFDGRRITGTPTETCHGLLFVTRAKDQSRRRHSYCVWERDFMVYQFDPASRVYSPGELIQFELRTPLSAKEHPVRATIDGVPLIRSPGMFCSFLLPDAARSGQLVVMQGSHRHEVGRLTIEQDGNPLDLTPQITYSTWFYDSGAAVMLVRGRNLTNATFAVGDVVVETTRNGSTWAILPFPAGANSEEVTILER
ncbi:MAG: hypothetical protein AAF581_04665 [Planctomycetota bacterium]